MTRHAGDTRTTGSDVLRDQDRSRAAPRPGSADGRRALREHAVERAAAARDRYGPPIEWSKVREMLSDPAVTRFPTSIDFDETSLERGEFAHLAPVGDRPSEGYRLFVHPRLRDREDLLPLAVAYHLVRVNYGDVATRVEAELFGATLLDLDVDRYYRALDSISDRLATGGDLP